MKLIRFLANTLNLSRRRIQEVIAKGAVRINGEVCESYSRALNSGDAVFFEDRIFRYTGIEKVYFLYHKPAGVVVSHSDRHNTTILENLPAFKDQKIFFAGRLDKDSRGLLIVTNDGEYVDHITKASNGIEKEYEVEVKGPLLGRKEFETMKTGILDQGERLGIFSIKRISAGPEKHKYRLILKQGRKREIRRIFKHFGCQVTDLFRVRIDRYHIEDLRPGELKEIHPGQY